MLLKYIRIIKRKGEKKKKQFTSKHGNENFNVGVNNIWKALCWSLQVTSWNSGCCCEKAPLVSGTGSAVAFGVTCDSGESLFWEKAKSSGRYLEKVWLMTFRWLGLNFTRYFLNILSSVYIYSNDDKDFPFFQWSQAMCWWFLFYTVPRWEAAQQIVSRRIVFCDVAL